MSVPNTNTFKLSDVKAELEDFQDGISIGSLSEAFTNAHVDGFDPVYEGSKDRLSNFRNYSNPGTWHDFMLAAGSRTLRGKHWGAWNDARNDNEADSLYNYMEIQATYNTAGSLYYVIYRAMMYFSLASINPSETCYAAEIKVSCAPGCGGHPIAPLWGTYSLPINKYSFNDFSFSNYAFAGDRISEYISPTLRWEKILADSSQFANIKALFGSNLKLAVIEYGHDAVGISPSGSNYCYLDTVGYEPILRIRY